MKPIVGYTVLLVIIGLVMFGPGTVTHAGDSPPTSPWSGLLLPAPEQEPMRQYLGLEKRAPFTIDQIAAEVVIVQVYSMYCPFCQLEAPRVNELYALIEKQAGLRRRVKLIGVGVGNSQFEVDFYRETYQVEFPLFPDGKFEIHKLLGETRTPHYYVIKPARAGKVEVVYEKVGKFESPEKFLKTVQNHLKNQ